MTITQSFQTLTGFPPRQFQQQAIAHSSFNGKNPRSHLLAHTDYNPEDKEQRNRLKAYEKKHKRPGMPKS